MSQIGPFLVLLGVMAAVIAAVGSFAAIYSSDARRVRRGLRRVLEGEPHALLVSSGSRRGVAFNFTSNMVAVAWDAGAWCLLYRIDEFVGAELIVDDAVIARAYRGETRKAAEVTRGAEQLVRLRLIFDDPRYPDFDLDLWTPAEGQRRNGVIEADAIQEGNRWIARSESLFRRKLTGAPTVRTPAAQTEAADAPAPARPGRGSRAPAADRSVDRLELPFDLDDDADDEGDDDDEEPALRVANG